MLLDLRNVFGEVSHNLLLSLLKYHHIPDHIIDLVKSLYTYYQLTIATDSYVTSPITVRHEVLQGDSLSPLLFNLAINTLINIINLVINTLINTITQGKINCMGYVYDGTFAPKHWMQFADDMALETSLESDNQYLCNAFIKWSTWSGLIIKVSKCHMFGVKKVKTDIIQYKPYITINKIPIPAVEISENFTYLGKDFNISMNCDHVKEELTKDITNYLKKIDILPLHPLQKIEICQLYIFSKLKWRFTIYHHNETWVNQNIDNQFSKCYCKWLQLQVCANITHLSLPNKKLGMKVKTAKLIYNECKITLRRVLKCSINEEARKLYEITTMKNVNSDSIVNKAFSQDLPNNKIKAKCKSILNKAITESVWDNFMGLKEQCILIKQII